MTKLRKINSSKCLSRKSDCIAMMMLLKLKSSGKKDFYEFDSDEDNTTQSTMESEVNNYLSNAERCECLNK